MKTSDNTPPIRIEPQTPATHAVIWLHGLGADGADFVPLVGELALPATMAVRFIFPHAPVRPITINNGYAMRGWFDILSLTREGKIDEAGIKASVQTVSALVAEQVQAGIAADHIVIAGFSQGAVIAMRTALQTQTKLAGILALSGYLPLAEPIQVDARARSPIFLAHGTEDAVVPYALGEQARHTLETIGLQVDWHTYPIGHTVSAQEVHDIARWLRAVFS